MTRVLAVALVIAIGASAIAEPAGIRYRDACARGVKYRGHRIDLDLRDATVSEVFRFLSEVGNVNVVIGDDVAGKVTLRLRRVPWDQVMCTIAATRQLSVEVDGTVYLVRKR